MLLLHLTRSPYLSLHLLCWPRDDAPVHIKPSFAGHFDGFGIHNREEVLSVPAISLRNANAIWACNTKGVNLGILSSHKLLGDPLDQGQMFT